MIRNLFLVIPSVFMRSIIALFAFHWVFFASAGAASACTPVAYLFRHAEDKNEDKTDAFKDTLTASGSQHASLYIAMMDAFQQEKSTYCLVSTVYALNPYKNAAPSPEIGTSNPYWTANPLANAYHDPTSGKNPNPIIEVNTMRLTEFLPGAVGSDFLEDIKDKTDKQQSVAIFWTSDGMCEVGRKLGPGLPGYTCPEGFKPPTPKPPRNSVFRYNYDVTTRQFTTVTVKYKQCFNYNKVLNNFSSNEYWCPYSANLTDFEQKLDGRLNELKGRICDTTAPDPTCKIN
jgi:hypothetical protein